MKINKVFHIDNEKNILGELKLGIAVDRWGNFTNENYKKLMKHKASIGICWEYHNQERDLREQEALKADREAELERIKAGAEGTLKPSDLVSLNKMTTEMSTNIKDFEGSRASIGIMNDAIALFEEAVDKNVKRSTSKFLIISFV